jgi:hypothetical protein
MRLTLLGVTAVLAGIIALWILLSSRIGRESQR